MTLNNSSEEEGENMSNRNVARAVRSVLITAGALSAGLYGPVGTAQERLDEIVVTGSRIAVRQDFEAASPVVTVGRELFEQNNATTVEAVLNTLPQFVPSVTSTSNNPSNGGQANVELRGLGTTRTLVLMDGKRIVPANPSGVVDLNIIPAALVENVEILTGGASAAYGSDAVAGVVNFRMNTRMEGVSVDMNWGETSESDGTEYGVSIAGGTSFGDGRGHIMGAVGYSDRDGVLQGDRKFSEVALGCDADSCSPLGSGTFRQGRYTAASTNLPTADAMDAVFGAGNVSRGASLGFNPDGSLFSVAPVFNFTGDTNEPLQPVNPASYTYNYAPPNYLQLPLERKNAFFRASIEATDSAELYVQGLWADYSASQQLASTPATSIYIPVTNPYIPADLASILASRPDPTQPFVFSKRMIESGPRISENNYRTWQIITGLQGDGLFNGNWNYDVYASFGEVDYKENQFGNVSRSRFEELSFAADAGASICGGGGMNPFGIESISPECADYFTLSAQNRTKVQMKILEGTISGPVYELPAGDLNMAFGAMYKEDEYTYVADDTLRGRSTNPVTGASRSDITGFNASDNLNGVTNSTELYVEALVPLLSDVVGARTLDLGLGYRFADYNTAGGVNSYKAELTWAPVDAVRVRGSYQRAVRAPTIGALFQPQVLNFPSVAGVGDPCSNDNPRSTTDPDAASVRDLCVQQGIPAASLPFYNYANSQVEGLAGGNPDLQEETADTYTVGVVFQPQFDGLFSNFSASVDYYNIKIEDAVGAISASTFIQRCFDGEYNPTYSNNNFYCQLFERKSTGEITNALEANSNIGGIETTGIDVQIDWAFDVGPGMLSFNWIASYLDSYKVQSLPGEAFEEIVGSAGDTIGSAFPEWKWTFNVGYNWGGLGVNARWRYVDGMVDGFYDDAATVGLYKLPSVDYFDLTASYSFEDGFAKGLTLRAGVTNLTDEDPIIYPSYQQSNTDPSTYDVLGRRYFLGLNYRF